MKIIIIIDLFRSSKDCRKILTSLFSEHGSSASTTLEYISSTKDYMKCIITSISFHFRKNSLVNFCIFFILTHKMRSIFLTFGYCNGLVAGDRPQKWITSFPPILHLIYCVSQYIIQHVSSFYWESCGYFSGSIY